jgi:hypothetical protein
MADVAFDKKIVLSDDKVLEDNEKARLDTEQLLSEYRTAEGLQNMWDRLTNMEDPEEIKRAKEAFSSMAFNKGRKLWIEVTVEDSYISGVLYSWLFVKSKFDKKPLHALGCSVDSIHFSPVGFTDEEKRALEILYKKACGQ